MACIGNLLPNQLKGNKIVKTATSKAVTVSYAVSDISDLDSAILATGISTGDFLFSDSNCLATNFEAESIQGQAPTAATVNVTYIGYDFYGSPTQDDDGNNLSYNYNEALNQDQTNFDIANKNTPLIVYYWPDKANIGQKNNQTAQQGCTIPVLKPYSNKTVKFFYVATDFPDDTLSELQGYVGQYNTDTWDGGDPKTWLCTGVTANCVGLAQQLLVECSFYYKPETWTQWAFFKDVVSGGSPIGALKDITDPQQNNKSNGAAGFLPYKGIDFGSSFGFD